MTGQDAVRRLGSARVDDIVTALSVDEGRRARLLVEMLAAALMAVEPEAAVIRALNGESLEGPPVTIVALGKAAPAMARGAAAVLGERLAGGIVVSNHAEKLPAGLELAITSHPAAFMPSSCHCRPSGHQSRDASTSEASSVTTAVHARPRAATNRSGTSTCGPRVLTTRLPRARS